MAFNIKNKGSANRRICIIPKTPDSQIIIQHSDNPTIGILNDGRLVLCLAPAPIRPPISCTNAIPSSGCITLEGLWDVEIEGVTVGTDIDSNDLVQFFTDNSTGIGASDCTDMVVCEPSAILLNIDNEYAYAGTGTAALAIYATNGLIPDIIPPEDVQVVTWTYPNNATLAEIVEGVLAQSTLFNGNADTASPFGLVAFPSFGIMGTQSEDALSGSQRVNIKILDGVFGEDLNPSASIYDLLINGGMPEVLHSCGSKLWPPLE